MASPDVQRIDRRTQISYRRLRRERGLCAEHGCKVVTGKTFRCLAHAREYAIRNQRYKVRKRQAEALARR